MRVRVVTGVLVCLGAGAVSLAMADAPAPASGTPTANAPAAPAAAPAADAAKPAAPAAAAQQMDQLEKHFRSEGYVVRMKDGEKLFCKREEVLGSRLSAGMKCATAEALKVREDQDQQAAEQAQRAARTGTLPNGG
jgi:hypothetical protein